MAIEEALCQIIEDHIAVSDYVGTRVYPVFVPEGESMPAIVYQQISGVPTYTTYSATTGRGSNGMEEAMFQISCWGRTPTEARNVANAVRNMIDGYEGLKEGVTVQGIFIRTVYDIPMLEPWTDQLNVFGKGVDVTVYFHEDFYITDGDYGHGVYGSDLYNNV